VFRCGWVQQTRKETSPICYSTTTRERLIVWPRLSPWCWGKKKKSSGRKVGIVCVRDKSWVAWEKAWIGASKKVGVRNWRLWTFPPDKGTLRIWVLIWNFQGARRKKKPQREQKDKRSSCKISFESAKKLERAQVEKTCTLRCRIRENIKVAAWSVHESQTEAVRGAHV